jgi:hydrocephalus-inducing protein
MNACMQATITFTPKQTGDHSGELLLCYDTGEKVYTKLYGSANNISVRLDKSSVSMENTFIGLSSHR